MGNKIQLFAILVMPFFSLTGCGQIVWQKYYFIDRLETSNQLVQSLEKDFFEYFTNLEETKCEEFVSDFPTISCRNYSQETPVNASLIFKEETIVMRFVEIQTASIFGYPDKPYFSNTHETWADDLVENYSLIDESLTLDGVEQSN